MAKSYHRASVRSYDNTDQALAATDANLSEYDEASQDGASSLVVESNVQVLAQRHGQNLALTSVLDEHIDVIDSDVEGLEGGQLTDDGYQPDAEVTEEEKVERKKTRTIDDGYVPDAEATEEENTKPVDRVGSKAVKKRDVRFEAVLETRKVSSLLLLLFLCCFTSHHNYCMLHVLRRNRPLQHLLLSLLLTNPLTMDTSLMAP